MNRNSIARVYLALVSPILPRVGAISMIYHHVRIGERGAAQSSLIIESTKKKISFTFDFIDGRIRNKINVHKLLYDHFIVNSTSFSCGSVLNLNSPTPEAIFTLYTFQTSSKFDKSTKLNYSTEESTISSIF